MKGTTQGTPDRLTAVTVPFAELEGASRGEIEIAVHQLTEALRTGHIPSFSDADRLALLRIIVRHADRGPSRTRARIARAVGEMHEVAGAVREAASLYERALADDRRVGVQRRLARLRRRS